VVTRVVAMKFPLNAMTMTGRRWIKIILVFSSSFRNVRDIAVMKAKRRNVII
jgi:hypothetical protein